MTARKITDKALSDSLDLSSKILTNSIVVSGPSNQIKIKDSNDNKRFDLGVDAGGKFFIDDMTAGLSRVTVDSSGNCGIGTTNPGHKLHVNGSTLLGSTTYVNGQTNSSLGALNVLQTSNASDQGISVWDNTQSRTMRIWVDDTDSYIYSAGNGESELHLNGVDGTTTVAGTLHANGNLRVPVSSTDPSGSASQGRIYFNSTSKGLKVYDGSGWVPVGGGLKRVSTFDIFGDNSTHALYSMDATGNDVGGTYNMTGDTTSGNFTAGQFGSSFNAVGTSHLLNNSSSMIMSGAHSVSFWYKSSTTNQNNKRLVTLQGASTCAGWNNYDGSLGFYLGNGRPVQNDTPSVTRVAQIPDSAVNNGQWHHLVYTVTTGGASATWKIYLDGSEYSGAVSGEGRSFNAGNSNTLAITTYDGGDAYNTIGQIDQLRILNRVITSTEVEQLYSAV